MTWSWKLGKLAGIDVYVHWTFLLLPLAILFTTTASGGTLAAAMWSIGFVLLIFGCVVLHELGHALMARQFGIGTRDITLLPIGGVAQLERMPKKPLQEIAVALAGPAVNVVIAGALLLGLLATTAVGAMWSLKFAASSLVAQLMIANIALVLFNLLPAFPMDGGRVLRALLAMRMPYVRATQVAARVGQIMAVALGVLGLFTSWTLTLVAMFIYFAARGEAAMTARQAAVGEPRVGHLMQQRFRVLPVEAQLRDVQAVLMQSRQGDFPVVRGRQLVGMLSATDLARHIEAGEEHLRVGDVMAEVAPAVEYDLAANAAAQMRAAGRAALPVVRAGELVGLLSLAQCARFMSSADEQHKDVPGALLGSESTRFHQPAFHAPKQY